MQTSTDYDKEIWTTAKFKDEFFKCLSKIPNAEIFYLDRKYYALAKQLIYKIPVYTKKEIINNKPVYKPAPPTFTFNISDLTPRCKEEFIQFVKDNSEKNIKLFLKEIAVKFFEAVDYDYTNQSVIRLLKVGFAD